MKTKMYCFDKIRRKQVSFELKFDGNIIHKILNIFIASKCISLTQFHYFNDILDIKPDLLVLSLLFMMKNGCGFNKLFMIFNNLTIIINKTSKFGQNP